jgi:hypothetical protein
LPDKARVPPIERLKAMFHATNPSYFGRPSSVLDASLELTSTVDSLRDISLRDVSEARPEDDNDDSDGRTGVSDTLSDFSAQLSLYFDAEENSGYFAALGAKNGGFRARVDALEQTHDDLRVSVASLRHLAHSTVASDRYDLGRRIASVVDEFSRHEVDEATLLQDFLHEGHAQPAS